MSFWDNGLTIYIVGFFFFAMLPPMFVDDFDIEEDIIHLFIWSAAWPFIGLLILLGILAHAILEAKGKE